MAARFEAIPAETAVKRGFSFSTGRWEAAGGITKTAMMTTGVAGSRLPRAIAPTAAIKRPDQAARLQDLVS